MARNLTPARQRTQYRLNGEADELQIAGREAPCRTDAAAWMDWDDPDEPAVFEAQVACFGCDFLDNCRERARLERPEHGVWAGEVWAGGRIVRRARRAQMRAHEEATAELE